MKRTNDNTDQKGSGFMLRNLAHLLVFLICLCLGLLTNLTLTSRGELVTDIPSAAKERNNDLHKLYEAALMSGERDMMQRFQCMSERADWLSSRLVVTVSDSYCIGVDGTFYPSAWPRFADPLRRVREEHPAWVRNNMAFVASVANRERATTYFYQHASSR